MKIFGFDERDVAGVARDGFVFGGVGVVAVEVGIGRLVHGLVLPASEHEGVNGSGSVVLGGLGVEFVTGGDFEEGSSLLAHKFRWKIKQIMNIL